MKRMLTIAFALATLAGAGNAQQLTLQPAAMSYVESLRSGLRADKVALLGQVVSLTNAEAEKFWPVYRKYEAETTSLNDGRVALIRAYLEKGPAISEADAKQLVDKAMDFDSARATLHKKYVAGLRKAGLSELTIVRLMQFEHRFDLLVEVKLASDLPALPQPAQNQ
jgi:hypothetical protein